MNEYRYLYNKDVAVPLARWDDVDGDEIDPQGRSLPIVGFRARRRLARAMSIELLQPEVKPYPKGSGFVRDDGELQLRVNQARAFAAELTLTKHPWSHIEYDQAKKICFQRGGPPGWFLIPNGLIKADAPSLRPEFKVVREMLERFAVPASPAPRYRQGTMHGWPDYLTTPTSYVLHALWARASSSFEELTRIGNSIAGIMEEETPFSAAMGNRTGPLGKPVAGYSRSATGARQDAEITGLCCRRRIVFMMPSAGNMWQVPYAWRVKAAQMQVPQLWHYGPAECAEKVHAAHAPGWTWRSDDISGYDQSVSDLHQRELAEEVMAPLIGQEAAAFKLQWKDLSLLGPGLTSQDQGFLYRKKGMTPSGDLMTALDGTLINLARLLRCVAVATGRTLEHVAAGLGRWWNCLVQGDDTVLGMSVPFDEAKYMEASAALGYATKLAPGVVFLMHAIDPATGAWTPLAARVFQQTVFNEYGGVSPAVELFSFIARTPDAFMLRNPWADRVLQLLRGAEPFLKYKVTPTTAREALRNPLFMADLATELRVTPKRAERFKNFDEAALSRSRLSDAVAALIDDRAETPLPSMPPAVAENAAYRLAAWMAKPRDERGSGPPSLGSDASDYLAYITDTDNHTTGAEADGETD